MNSKKGKNDKILEFTSKDGRVLAIVFRHGIEADGVRFLTPEHHPLQIGILHHRSDKRVSMHLHKELDVAVKAVHEVLYVESGRAHIEIADESWEPIGKTIIETGDIMLFCGAAHSIKIEKGTRIIEIKQGPYPGSTKAKIHKS